MKVRFDKKSVARVFQSGDHVLVLLPVVGSALQAKFSGPYLVDRQLSETDYVIRTPDRRKKTCVCHINMLKKYVGRENCADPSPVVAPVASMSVIQPPYNASDDGLNDRHNSVPCARLRNYEVFSNLDVYLEHLPDSARSDIRGLIQDFPILFGDIPTQTNVIKHDIVVENHKPLKQRAYRVHPIKRDMMQKEVQYLLDHGFAVPSSNSWSSPSILVPKSDQTPRFCHDYRKVNVVTKPDSFPLSLMDDLIDRVRSAKYVTKLDLLKGYLQVPLTRRASEISAFVTPDHFLQYTVMPFGLRNAPATFQRLMNTVLCGVGDCEVYSWVQVDLNCPSNIFVINFFLQEMAYFNPNSF